MRNIIYIWIKKGRLTMSEKKQFVYFMNAKKKDGETEKYPIYKSGEDYYIGEHKVPAGTDIEDEIRSLYGAEVIGPEMPHPMHEETKFRKL
jgi:hypothetical protein